MTKITLHIKDSKTSDRGTVEMDLNNYEDNFLLASILWIYHEYHISIYDITLIEYNGEDRLMFEKQAVPLADMQDSMKNSPKDLKEVVSLLKDFETKLIYPLSFVEIERKVGGSFLK